MRQEIPQDVLDWMWSILGTVSDEVGTEAYGDYLLAFEGWSGICISEVWDEELPTEENEERAYAYAEEESEKILEEWKEMYEPEGYVFIDGGYERDLGLYGVTWALFWKRRRNSYI
jgi:hypothetical protein